MKGVLLINLGTPDAPTRSAVYRYLKQFLLDRRVIDVNWLSRNFLVRCIIAPFRSKESTEGYKLLWTENGSPLKYYGEKLTEGVQEVLGNSYKVVLGMRYQNPSIESALKELEEADVTDVTILPLFPHYASASSGSALEEVMRVMMKKWEFPSTRIIQSFYDNEDMIDIFVENARKYKLEDYDHFLFSFHGLPERQLIKANYRHSYCLKKENCCDSICGQNQFCYSSQSHRTAFLIAEKLGLSRDQYTICFQSRLGKEEWQKPYTSDVLEDLAKKGIKNVLTLSPAFVADCLETTVEITHEYREEFQEMGGEKLDLVESLNDNPKWIKAVADMVR